MSYMLDFDVYSVNRMVLGFLSTQAVLTNPPKVQVGTKVVTKDVNPPSRSKVISDPKAKKDNSLKSNIINGRRSKTSREFTSFMRILLANAKVEEIEDSTLGIKKFRVIKDYVSKGDLDRLAVATKNRGNNLPFIRKIVVTDESGNVDIITQGKRSNLESPLYVKRSLLSQCFV